MKEIIYVAAPYAHPDYWVRRSRVRWATVAAANFASEGFGVFSPLSHSAGIAECQPKVSEDYWYELDLKLMVGCDKLVVCKLPGWEESEGVQKEIKRANELNMEINYIEQEDILP